MAIIAVSGGTGKLGRAIVEALKSTGYQVKILARSANAELSKEIDVPIIPVDYANVDSLTAVLEENKINVAISTILLTGEAQSTAQLNLIEAATRSYTTKRFIPSDFGIIYTEAHAQLIPILKGKLAAAEKLRSSGLEYTLVSTGFFMDYYGLPKVKSYLQPFIFAVDMCSSAAAIPGSGNTPVAFTHTFDVAKFVAALMDQESWPERSIVVGDKKTWNEVVAIAEEVKGTKFNVTYDNEEKLKTFQVTELPSHTPLYPFYPKVQLQYFLAVYGRWADAGHFDLPEKDTLNARFPQIRAMSMTELLEQGWKT
ncbi:hypothetical protein AJ79_08200 [Helicocarpus griseus UAMH5409]|uniref:NmrA-like domain-containing protein n=1 Tax=Helicocarpus griseus UAMH5409 TaxID=1447875 RepID=A0A2B7WV44_9EURO|nr:hypothetical protein AJ79_10229 [Helicocarpus griseus UAMH5409]PGH00427.1 hypothetical protein AJ79_08200 [Helicocarpus griseus UAMH5409]